MTAMRSPRTVAGAAVLLAGVPVAFAILVAFGNGAEATIHVALGVGFALFALAAFDFHLPRWAEIVAAVGVGALALIFLAQAAADLTGDAAIRTLAYEQLGQRLEKILGYVFLLWCFAILLLDSRGRLRMLGFVVAGLVAVAEIYAGAMGFAGSPAPETLKLLYMPLFVWLLLEGWRPAGDALDDTGRPPSP